MNRKSTWKLRKFQRTTRKKRRFHGANRKLSTMRTYRPKSVAHEINAPFIWIIRFEILPLDTIHVKSRTLFLILLYRSNNKIDVDFEEYRTAVRFFSLWLFLNPIKIIRINVQPEENETAAFNARHRHTVMFQ